MKEESCQSSTIEDNRYFSVMPQTTGTADPVLQLCFTSIIPELFCIDWKLLMAVMQSDLQIRKVQFGHVVIMSKLHSKGFMNVSVLGIVQDNYRS